MRGKVEEFEKRNAQVLAIDPHESYRVRHMLRSVQHSPGDLAYPLLADPAHTVSATYGVAFQMQVHTEWSNRPATFIIDKSGIIRFAQRGRNYGDRPRVPKLIEELEKL